MVLTQLAWQERKQQVEGRSSELPGLYLQRYRKVKLTMNRIKQVLRCVGLMYVDTWLDDTLQRPLCVQLCGR